MKNYMSISEFYKIFPDEDACETFIAYRRWRGKPVCPFCNHDKIYEIAGSMRFKCGQCKKRFSVRTGTVMEKSKLSLQTWLLASYLITTARKGISSIQFAKELGVTQKTAWFLSNRIRAACGPGKSLLHGEIEVDETYIGGKEKNKHRHRRIPGHGPFSKQPVVGLYQRDGIVRAKPIPNAGKTILQAEIASNVEQGSTVYTDESVHYRGLQHYIHKTVSHKAREYVKGDITTNGIESFWAVLKRSYIGIHHWWSPKHLHRYVNEHAYRQNTKHLTGLLAISNLLENFVGKRLTYAELIAD